MDVEPRHYKQLLSLSSGVANFSPDIVDDEEEYESKRLWLKEHSDINHLSQDEKRLEIIYFKYTFPLQRKYLNNFKRPPLVTEIILQWPHLGKIEFILLHFEEMQNIKIINLMINLDKYADKIMDEPSTKNVSIFSEKNP